MKKLGLIGGTGPESTVPYYRGVVYGVQERCGNFPPLAIESLSVFDVLGFCDGGDYDGLAAYLLRGFDNLAAAGCDLAALTGITPHMVFDQLEARSPLPLVSIVDAARDYAVARGHRRVGLLGTYPTMTGRFFHAPFEEAGIEVVTPPEAEMRLVQDKIERELELARVLPQTVTGLRRIARRLVEKEHADAVVLGCTELPLAFEDFGEFPLIDVMDVHIKRLVELVLADA